MAAPKGHEKYDGTKVDKEELLKLARLHLTTVELAQWFKCSRDLLDRPPYIDIINQGKSETKQRLKQKALQRGLVENSDTMLIFCLKNYCGWGDGRQQEISRELPTQVPFKLKGPEDDPNPE